MSRALPALLLAIALPASSESGALSTKQIGSGGGYVHPSPEAGDYLENGPRSEMPPAGPAVPEAPVLRKPPVPTPTPAPAAPDRGLSRGSAASTLRQEAADRGLSRGSAASTLRQEAAKPAPAPAPAKPQSLWDGLVKPLAAGGDEAARAYDGAAEKPALAETAPPAAMPGMGSGEAERPRDALFVSVELDPGEAGTLRDAVAGLTSAGFTADHRFEPRSGVGRNAVVTGWLPSSRLAEAVSRPGVRKVSIETSARPAARAQETEGAFLIGLRVSDPARPVESIEPALRELARDAGLRERRVLGLETAPDGRVVAVVAGRLPLSRLSKALARADVVKLVPAPAPGALTVPAAPRPVEPSPGGFARFMATRGLWLVLLTLAVGLLPPARAGLGRGLRALVPYH